MSDLTKMSVEELNQYTMRRIEGWRNMGEDDVRAAVLNVICEHSAELTRRTEVPKGHVKLDDGRVVRVLGELPMTADRCVAEYGRVYWCWCPVPMFTGLPTPSSWRIDIVEKTLESCDPDDDYEGSYTKYPASCFSTYEAAKAAALAASEKGVGQ